MDRWRRGAIVGVAALAASGCLLFTDIAGLDAEDAVAVDGGDSATPAVDAIAGDSSVDADASGADAATRCKTSDAAFCQDFDDGVLVGRWTTLDPSDGGRTLEISNAVSKSPSSSLHSVIDRALINPAPGDCSYARARRDLSELGARMQARFSFDAWLGAASGTAPVEGVLAANLNTSRGCNFIISLDDTQCGVLVQFTRDGSAVGEGGSGALVSRIGKTWAHVELYVSFDPSMPTWSLSVNGQTCGGAKAMPPECQSAQAITVAPGVYCEDKGTGIAEMYIDNVEVR